MSDSCLQDSRLSVLLFPGVPEPTCCTALDKYAGAPIIGLQTRQSELACVAY
ncbi:hypothetical protein H4S08_001649 [Coemansia sp. RSA 1365]|nr:hypothetical protein H4S08_001649 [Coemansia sp. RSA 1365]